MAVSMIFAHLLLMHLLFQSVCVLLERCDAGAAEDSVREWFSSNVNHLTERREKLALLSCLLPALRHDRRFGLSQQRIVDIVAQAHAVGMSRVRELRKALATGTVDCGTALMRAVHEGGKQTPYGGSVTIIKLDQMLDMLAALCVFSDGLLRERGLHHHRNDTIADLVEMCRRMTAVEVKWAVRLLQRDLRPAIVPETLVLEMIHPQLPSAWQLYNSLSVALEQLEQHDRHRDTHGWRSEPQMGTMVGLPVFEKARSLKHATMPMRGAEVSVERKYDGEYCQVHMWRPADNHVQIKLFSKSGRDSTQDRLTIVPAIRKCLGVDTLPSRVEKRCILAGELVVWNDNLQNIMPFHKLRRHIPRAGRWIGCRGDPAPDPAEHLMIVFHDLLCWDDRVNVYHSYEHRREHLRRLVSPILGRAVIGFSILLDFGRTNCVSRLAREMAYALSQRWEGLVLKACQDPYINSAGSMSQLVKLKKDYIPGLGDSVDLLVIGGRTDAAMVQSLKLPSRSWTTFFLGCRESSPSSHDGGDNEVVGTERYRIISQVAPPAISVSNLHLLNMQSRLSQIPFSFTNPELSIATELRGRSLPSHLFSQPAVVEVVGAGFDRPPNAQYLTLRFPRIHKVHNDRNAEEVVDFAEYQHLAASGLEGGNEHTQYASWLGRLDVDHADDGE